jgi:hypothetical protein
MVVKPGPADDLERTVVSPPFFLFPMTISSPSVCQFFLPENPMKKFLLGFVVSTLLVVFAWGTAMSLSLFALDGRAEDSDGKPYPLDHLVHSFQIGVQSIPLLLSAYLESGDLVLVQQLRENNEALNAYLKAIEKQIGNDDQKSAFAKISVAFHKLQEIIDRDLKAMDDFRRLRRAYDKRSTQLLEILSPESPSPYRNAGSYESEIHKKLQEVRLAVVKAISATQVLPCSTADQTHRKRTKQMWDGVLQHANELTAVSGESGDRESSLRLARAAAAAKKLAEELVVQGDELTHSWEQTLPLVQSLELLIEPILGTKPGSGTNARPNG